MFEFLTSTTILKLAAIRKFTIIITKKMQPFHVLYELPCSFKKTDFWNVSPEALSWQMCSPNGFVLIFLVSIWSSPLVEVATVCPFLMNESIEKGGNWIFALQVRMAPLFLVAACLSESRLNVRSKSTRTKVIASNSCQGLWCVHGLITFVITDINTSFGESYMSTQVRWHKPVIVRLTSRIS